MVTYAPIDRPLTAEDLAELPDDGIRYELIWGELYMSPAPELRHQIVSMNLTSFLLLSITGMNRGMVLSAPVDVIFDENNVVQPDLIVVATDNKAAVQGNKFSGIPDLLIEILSPQSRSRDFVKKSLLYSRNQVPEYWIVDPSSEQVRVYSLEGDSYVERQSSDGVARSVRFPGLEVDPSGLFSLPESMRS